MTNPGANAEAIVVGAGVIGASIALELQRHGRQVLVVDKGEAVGGGSTSSSSSIIRHTYSTIEGVIAAWESMHCWLDWVGHLGRVDGPQCRFHQIGMLHIDPPGHDRSALLANFDRVGVRYEELDSEQLERRFPSVDTGRYWPPRLPRDPHFFDAAEGRVEAIFMPDAGFIDDPQLAAVNLMDAARHHGAEVWLRSEVTAVNRGNDGVRGVTLADGRIIDAAMVVNAAGPWSSMLNRLAGVTDDLRITTRALRQTVASTTAPDEFGVGRGGVMVGDIDLGAYFRPQPGGSFIVGGVEAGCDPLVWVDDPGQAIPTPDPEDWQAVMYRAARRVPALPIPRRPTGLADHYDVTDDWIPIYDRSSLDGFYLAIGTSGNQFKNAPLVGQMMNDLVTACEGGHDHDADPVQVHCGRTGWTLDLGHYSRLREPTSTSGTVMG